MGHSTACVLLRLQEPLYEDDDEMEDRWEACINCTVAISCMLLSLGEPLHEYDNKMEDRWEAL